MRELADALSSPGGDLLVGMTALVATGVAFVAVVGIMQWRKHRQNEMNFKLKQEMIQRGMSVDEIERVLKASDTSLAGR